MIPWFNKPPVGTQLDPSHPSTVGLLDYFPGWEAGGQLLTSIGPRRSAFTFGAGNSWTGAPADKPQAGVGVTGNGANAILDTTDPYYNAWTQAQPFSVGFFATLVGTTSLAVWTNIDSTISYRGIGVEFSAAGKLQLYVVYQWTANAFMQPSATTFVVGQTYHCIVTYDGTRGTGSTKMYINGIADTMPAPTNNTLAASPSIATSTRHRIGSRPTGTTGINGSRISDLAIWGRVLPPGEAIAFQANPFAWFEPTVPVDQVVSVFFSGTTFSEVGSGGLILGGSATPGMILRPASSGGLILGGSAVPAATLKPPASGGLVLGGVVTVAGSTVYTEAGAGGLKLGGVVAVSGTTVYVEAGAGGLKLGGTAPVSVILATAPPSTFRAAVASRLKATAGTRVYPIQPPQSWDPGRDGPCVTWEVQSDEPGISLDGFDGTYEAVVTVSVWATSRKAAAALADDIEASWLGFSGTIGTVEFDEVAVDGREEDELIADDGTDRRVWQVSTDFWMGHR